MGSRGAVASHSLAKIRDVIFSLKDLPCILIQNKPQKFIKKLITS